MQWGACPLGKHRLSPATASHPADKHTGFAKMHSPFIISKGQSWCFFCIRIPSSCSLERQESLVQIEECSLESGLSRCLYKCFWTQLKASTEVWSYMLAQMLSANVGLILRNIHWISANSHWNQCNLFTLRVYPFIRNTRAQQDEKGEGKLQAALPLGHLLWRQSEFASSASPESSIQGSFLQTTKFRNSRIWSRIKDSGLDLFSACASMYVCGV